jgi:Type IV secretion-system coupling protein DNA-binding domain
MEWWQLKEEYLKPIGGFLLLPYVLFREVKEQTDLWKAKGHSRASGRGETGELRALVDRLSRYREEAPQKREALVQGIVRKIFTDRSSPGAVAAARLLSDMIDYEGLLSVPDIDLRGRKLSTSEIWERSAALTRALHSFEKPEALEERLERLVRAILSETDLVEWKRQDGEAVLAVPLYTLLPDPALAVERVLGEILTEDQPKSLLSRIWLQLKQNMYTASGIDPAQETSREPIWPGKARMETGELIDAYLGNTLFARFLQTAVPFGMPLSARFEHTHIVGGSGHGKTQLLQQMILKDLAKLEEGKGSIIVIDSQGDLLRNILSLASVSRLSERLVLIDPTDIDNPPALNLFDFGLERLTHYSPMEREKLLNGAIALYEYLFGALLGAELTQKQGVIFRYLARLMLSVPGATIRTLMGFMENPESTRPYLARLDPTSQHFFQTQFFSRAFDDTRQQILTRLWGVLSNTVLERMFAHEKNRLDLFAAMNRGSLILINTAKDLLKQEGCEILGRFFIALVSQAAQERAAIPEDRRRSTFVYIDEAQDYFDESIQSLFNQARKYKVGLVIAHQNLDQFDQKLRAAVLSSTSVKLVGGLSAKDAGIFAKEMNCDPEFLQNMRKAKRYTQFACYVRNHTRRPIAVTVPLGQMEKQAKLTSVQVEQVLAENRRRYGATGDGTRARVAEGETLLRPDLL